MCTVSMISDHYTDMWKQRDWFPNILLPQPVPDTHTPPPGVTVVQPEISRAEFDQLRKEVADLRDLLKRAKEYDAATGQPDCEMDEKIALLRKVAELVGVDLDSALSRA